LTQGIYRIDEDGDGRISAFVNETASVDASVHLLAGAHLWRAQSEVQTLLDTEEIATYRRERNLILTDVRLGTGRFFVDRYHKAYDPLRTIIELGSDETTADARDEKGRLKKLVPTIVHHEFGHHVYTRLTGSSRDVGVNEGFSDALASYVSRIPTIGYVSPEEPNADPWARDLRDDRIALSDLADVGEARRVVAGALWQLWESTLDPQSPGGGRDGLRKSSFA